MVFRVRQDWDPVPRTSREVSEVKLNSAYQKSHKIVTVITFQGIYYEGRPFLRCLFINLATGQKKGRKTPCTMDTSLELQGRTQNTQLL